MNSLPNILSSASCGACRETSTLFPFSMAFQPIIDADTRTVYAYEALARGPQQESAASVLAQVNNENRYAFDQACRVKAITLAAKLGIASQGARLSVNFMPGAVYSPAACIRQTLQAATEQGFPLEKLTFEITEDERVRDAGHLQLIVAEYKKHGFTVALDDFGSGYSGLNLLSELAVDVVKLDIRLLRDIDQRPRAETVVRATVSLCRSLGVKVIAEGVETPKEYAVLRRCGIHLMQGYLFAKPAFESLPAVTWPGVPKKSGMLCVIAA